MTDFSLSFSDLMLVDGFKEAVVSSDTQAVNRILFTNGMDVSKKFGIRTCNHRNLQGKEFNGPRFEGQERLDQAWIKSGAASMEAIIESTKDPVMRHELRVMSTQVQQDRAWSQGEL